MTVRVKRAKKFVTFMRENGGNFEEWRLPIEVKSESNLREHWAQKNRRKNEQSFIVRTLIKCSSLVRWQQAFQKGPLRITFTKLGGRRLDRSNLPVSFKGIEDTFAWLMGCNDGHGNWRPAWEQEPGGPVGIKIRIEAIS